MLKLMREAFSLFFTAMYINVRGESETFTVATGETFTQTHHHETSSFRFVSAQFKHVEKFKHWYRPNIVRYTYLVQAIELRDGEMTLLQTIPMPMQCWNLFARTTLPHRLACSACLRLFVQT